MIKLEFNSDLKNDCKKYKLNYEFKDTCTFEMESLIANIVMIITKNDDKISMQQILNDSYNIAKEYEKQDKEKIKKEKKEKKNGKSNDK